MYFNEAHETAKEAVSNTLSKFEALLADLTKPEADKLQRSMGMKMQQLKVRPTAYMHCVCTSNQPHLTEHHNEELANGSFTQAELLELDELHA